MVRDPSPLQVPDFVPDEWVADDRDKARCRRHEVLAAELVRVERSARRDASILLTAASLCAILLVVALVWTSAFGSAATGLSLEVGAGVALLVAFGTCLWLIRRARRDGARHEMT